MLIFLLGTFIRRNVGLEIISNVVFSLIFFFFPALWSAICCSVFLPICAATSIIFQPFHTGSLALWKCCHLPHWQEKCSKQGFLSHTMLSDFSINGCASAQHWQLEGCLPSHDISTRILSGLGLSADTQPMRKAGSCPGLSIHLQPWSKDLGLGFLRCEDIGLLCRLG